MSISTSASKVVARGNGVATIFNYGFKIPDAASILVVYTDAAGVQTTLLPSQFSVTGLGTSGGGAVTYPLAGPAIANGTSLTILRQVAYTQPTSLVNQANYSPASVEGALDWLEMQIQQAVGIVGQGLSYPAVDVNPINILPPAAARAGKFFAFDGNGNPAMLPGNNLAGDLLAYSLGGATFNTAQLALHYTIGIDHGWYVAYTTAMAGDAYGYAAYIQRSGGAGLTVGGILTAENLNGSTSDAFGIALQAWNAPGGNGSLIAIDLGTINETNNCTKPKLGTDYVFKNRPDGAATVTQGLGANEYNLASAAMWIDSQPRSTANEFCGWRRGMFFKEFSMDADANGGGIGIDFAYVHYYGGSNPLTAYRMTAAIRMRDFQSILWNGDPTLPNDPTEPAANALRTYFDSSIGRFVWTTAGVEKFGISVSTGDIYKAGVLVTGASTAGNNTWTGTNTFQSTFTLQTDLVFSGARKITGDFSNATLASRVNVQSNVVNGNTDLCLIPNGASTQSSINLFNAAGMANCGFLHIGISNGEASIQSSQLGAGAAMPLTFYAGAAGSAERMRVSTTNGQLLVNTTVESSVSGAKLRVSGIVVIDNAEVFMVNLGGVGMALPSGPFTLVIFTTKEYDQNNDYNTGTGRFVPPAGKFRLTAAIGNTGSTDQARFYCAIYKNGLVHKASSFTASGVAPHSAQVSCTVDANGADYFEVYAWQNSGGAYTISGNAQDSFFCGERIG